MGLQWDGSAARELEEGRFNGSHLHIGIVIAAMEWMTDLEHGLC